MKQNALLHKQLIMKPMTRQKTMVFYRYSYTFYRVKKNAFYNNLITTQLISMSNISKVLQKHFKNKNVSHIARATGISTTTLHEWKSGKRSPSLKNIKQLKKLCDEFGLTLEELLVGEEDLRLISAVSFEDSGRHYRVKIERLK